MSTSSSPRGKLQACTMEELRSLLLAIDTPRYRLATLVGFWHGLRVSEILALKGRNIRSGMVAVKRLKGSLPTLQPYMSSADSLFDEATPLRELEATVKDNELLFPLSRSGFWRVIQKAGERAGIPEHKRHPHMLKHTVARRSIHQAGIHNTRQWLGHKSMASTGEYLKVTDEEAAVAVGAAIAQVA